MNEADKQRMIEAMRSVDKQYDSMTLFGCKYCLFKRFEMVIDRTMFDSLDKLIAHVEKEHDVVIRKPDESEYQALTRAEKENSRVGTKNCRCPHCLYRMTEYEITEKILESGRATFSNGTIYIVQINQPMVELCIPARRS